MTATIFYRHDVNVYTGNMMDGCIYIIVRRMHLISEPLSISNGIYIALNFNFQHKTQ